MLLYRSRKRTYCEKNAGDRDALHGNGKLLVLCSFSFLVSNAVDIKGSYVTTSRFLTQSIHTVVLSHAHTTLMVPEVLLLLVLVF